jgi:putative FmdB family regulatory protein
MPIYEYTCSQCQKLTDVLQKLNELAPERCPACGADGTLSRVVSRTSFVLKGGGWGADLYGSKKSAEKSDSAAEGAKPGEKSATPAPAAGTTPAAPTGTTGSSGSSPSAPAPAVPAPVKKDGGS